MFRVCLKISGLVALLLLVACNRQYDPVPEHVYQIYPIQEGKQRTYAVTDTLYETTNSSGFEARRYLRREINEGFETDLLDREVAKLFIYISPDSSDTNGNPFDNFRYEELWTQYSGDVYAERIEGNIRNLVLKVPAQEGLKWNGALYASLDGHPYPYSNHIYEYTTVDTTVTVQGVTYDNCVFVLKVPFRENGEIAPQRFYIKEYAYEIYAPRIGMIVRHEQSKVYQGLDLQADQSWYLHEELTEHTFE